MTTVQQMLDVKGHKVHSVGSDAMVLDIHISDQVVSPRMRKTVHLGHGVM